jgi:hypothetical protein
LVVCDLDRFEVHTNFTGTAKVVHAFDLDGLADPKNLEVLRKLFTDPEALRPGLTTEAVTRQAAERFGQLADALRLRGIPAQDAAHFLMKLMFCMFAEDIGLLPERCFTDLLKRMRGRDPKQLVYALEILWDEMDRGVPFSSTADDRILQFNGRLFKERAALPLKPEHLGLLIEAAERSWRYVEPAIFGTFLEQALDPRERRKLGAEFTPRRWVERLVMPAVIEPLRERWNNVKATALAYGIVGNRDAAIKAVKEFHHELCHLRILDRHAAPAISCMSPWSI